MGPFAVQHLSGWGRFPVEGCHVFRPEKRRLIGPILAERTEQNYIARGLGRSYGDAAVNGGAGVIDNSRLNRMISFDAEAGILECEAGVSLAEILDAFVPRGFFLSVLPGTKFVTVGGAIANDVHGKNHHRDGSFSRFVDGFELLTAGGEVIACSPVQNADVFWATSGGIGLTGIILTARIRLQRVDSAYMAVDYFRAHDIDDALAAMADSDERYQYSVGWVDCLARGRSMGRSVLMRANHAERSAVRGNEPYRVKRTFPKTVPFDFPGIALNSLSIRAFNECYYRMHPTAHGKVFDYDTYFCPLDSIQHWNRMYGKRGFGQYQVTFPKSNSGGLRQLLERISRSSCASFLAVLKQLGPAGPGLLSYPSAGYTITFDIPMRRDLVSLLRDLDKQALEQGGRLYCAKDATTLPETFAAMYPRLDEFRAIKARLDPDNVFSSSMGRRLGIVGGPNGGADHG
jgi:FAD/FMN-containing dehydrogenase